MDIHIDLHMVATVVGMVLTGLFFTAWMRYFRRADALVFLVGVVVSLFVASQGELSVSRIETVMVAGLVITAVLTLVFGLCRANARKGRLLRQSFGRRSGRGHAPLQFTQAQARGRLQDIHNRRTVPAPEPETRSIPDDVYYDDEEDEEDYYAPRPAQRHGARSRARGSYVVHPGGVQTARRGRLQQGGR